MAQMRSADGVRKCLLFGIDRTYHRHHETDAFDPEADMAIISSSPIMLRAEVQFAIAL